MVNTTLDPCEVRLWGHTIAAAYWDSAQQMAAFEYEPSFQSSGIEIAPLMMPLSTQIYRVPQARRTSFEGLPGLLADSLPDCFGDAVIAQWLIREGRRQQRFNPIERLRYIGQRGMGALEYRPSIRATTRGSMPIDVSALTQLAQHVFDLQAGLKIRVRATDQDYARLLDGISRVGTSARGQRAKAVVAWNPSSKEMRSGQDDAPQGFEYWLLKLDGVGNRDVGMSEPRELGRIEYAYSLMAAAAGMDMTKCRLLEENGRSHFMTRRFDRLPNGEKVHVQSLYAIAHLDNRLPGAHSYEQAFQVMRRLEFPQAAFAEQFRRMVFNVVARNQNDHTRKIAYLMDKAGHWSLAPAFDVNFALARRHQMTINGVLEQFKRADFREVARRFRIRSAEDLIDEVVEIVGRWPEFAANAGVSDEVCDRIAATHRHLQS